MKRTLNLIGLITALVIVVSFSSCKEETEIKRTWTDVDINGKKVTIKDMRTGTGDTNLEAMGVYDKLVDGLAQISPDLVSVIDGLTIEVEKTTDYSDFKAYSKKRMGASIDYVLSNDANFKTRMELALSTMKSMARAIPPQDANTRRLASVNADTLAVTKGANS